jgi:uncharacterized phage-like protein YoqJ
MNIAFTGHRPNKLGHDYDLKSPLVMKIRGEIIRHLASLGYKLGKIDSIIVGMALGIDTLAAEISIDLKIPFIAAIPFNGQHLKWPFKSRERYLNLLSKAAEIVNVSGADYYKPEFMQQRNIWMVDQLTGKNDYLIAVHDGSSGGTFNCVQYATGKVKIITINPKKL